LTERRSRAPRGDAPAGPSDQSPPAEATFVDSEARVVDAEQVTPPQPAPATQRAEDEPADDATSVLPLIPAPADGASSGMTAATAQPDTVYVPLAVTIGDGFKFGCGFFLALVLAMLVGFVLLAALFVLTSLFGLNLPMTR
jgi:hypothetical protein